MGYPLVIEYRHGKSPSSRGKLVLMASSSQCVSNDRRALCLFTVVENSPDTCPVQWFSHEKLHLNHFGAGGPPWISELPIVQIEVRCWWRSWSWYCCTPGRLVTTRSRRWPSERGWCQGHQVIEFRRSHRNGIWKKNDIILLLHIIDMKCWFLKWCFSSFLAILTESLCARYGSFGWYS